MPKGNRAGEVIGRAEFVFIVKNCWIRMFFGTPSKGCSFEVHVVLEWYVNETITNGTVNHSISNKDLKRGEMLML